MFYELCGVCSCKLQTPHDNSSELPQAVRIQEKRRPE